MKKKKQPSFKLKKEGKEIMVKEVQEEIYGILRTFGIPKDRAFIVANLVKTRLKEAWDSGRLELKEETK